MKFNELSGDTKKKVTGNVTDDLDNYMQEEFKKETFSIDGLRLRYLLEHERGDGVSFVGSINGDNLKKLPFAHLIKDDISITFTLNYLANYYSHVNTVDVFIDYDEEKYTCKEYNQLENAVKSWYRDVCKRLEKSGYDYLDAYEMEDEDDVRFSLAYDEFTGGKWTII